MTSQRSTHFITAEGGGLGLSPVLQPGRRDGRPGLVSGGVQPVVTTLTRHLLHLLQAAIVEQSFMVN